MSWRFRDWPVRRKLELVTVVASLTVLSAGLGGSFVYHAAVARTRTAGELRSLADVVGATGNAALAFRDPRAATQVLAALKARPSIVAAALYDRNGNRVADYRRATAGSRPAPSLPLEPEQWTDDSLAVSVPVVVEGSRIGTVYLEDDLRALGELQRNEWLLLAGLIPVSLLLVSWFSKPFRRPIARPVQELAQLARRASRDRDYSVRAHADSADEIGVLADGFNNLIARLEELHHRIGEHGDELETEVSRRTIELRQLNSELRAAKDAADAANLAKTQFIANVSHELRTPITGILGTAHLLSSSSLDDEQHEWLGMVIQSAETLLSLIDDLLDFSRIEAGRMSIESVPFNPREETQAAVRMLTHQAEEKGLRVDCVIRGDVPGAVIGDPVRFRQVITNLLGNAVKFTVRGSVRVTLSVNQAGPADVELRGEVSDTGIGIPLDRQDAIFNPFTQADPSTTRRFGGSGLGLAICARLLAMMGGRIWVDSAPGRGSTFSFTVRARRTTEQPLAPRGSAPVVELRRLTILCAEDSPITQRVTTQLLTRAGHRVDLAQTGSEAVALVAHQRYDVVLMDLQMPEMDGLAATQAIRASEQRTGSHVPIVALTAHALPSDRTRCLEAGMDGYVSKPFRPGELMRAIADALPETTRSTAVTVGDPPALPTAGMTDVLIAEYQSKMAELEAAVVAGQMAEVRALVHRLKSAMALFHTGEPFSIADRLERLSAAGDRAGVTETWPLLHRHLQRILEELHRT